MVEEDGVSRRRFLKASGVGVFGSGSLAALSEDASAADRRYMSITGHNDVEISYTFEITTYRTPFWEKDLRGEGNLNTRDTTTTSSGDATGYVVGGTDTYSFKGQLNSFVLAAGPGAKVEVDLWGWEGYDDINGVKISSDSEDMYSSTGNLTKTRFETSGDVSAPGDGTLEGDDVIGDQYGISYTRESGQDHFNFDGMPTNIVIEPDGDYSMFNRYVASEW
jgi:hypothetical protein